MCFVQIWLKSEANRTPQDLSDVFPSVSALLARRFIWLGVTDVIHQYPVMKSCFLKPSVQTSHAILIKYAKAGNIFEGPGQSQGVPVQSWCLIQIACVMSLV